MVHGGIDEISFKPNHLSVMNYNFQIYGINKDSIVHYQFQDLDCMDINQLEYNELNGIKCNTNSKYITRILANGETVPINTPIDFNHNGILDNSTQIDFMGNGQPIIPILRGGINEYKLLNLRALGPFKIDRPRLNQLLVNNIITAASSTNTDIDNNLVTRRLLYINSINNNSTIATNIESSSQLSALELSNTQQELTYQQYLALIL